MTNKDLNLEILKDSIARARIKMTELKNATDDMDKNLVYTYQLAELVEQIDQRFKIFKNSL